jgi:CRISPR-associated protein Cmr2
VSDRFWLTKIRTLVKSLNLEYIKELLNEERANFYLDTAINLTQHESVDSKLLQAINDARLINDASDRAIFNRIEINNNNNYQQIIVKHLLSGARLGLNLEATQTGNIKASSKPEVGEQRAEENVSNDSLPELFWWLWRCLPQAIAKKTGAESLLIPASNNLPDASLWSDASLSSALAGALVGYKDEDVVGEVASSTSTVRDETESRPQIVIFSFSPIQELIKASRKMRDFWAGSWLLHYLSAKICWNIASKYGADSLVYPSLYQQPLIDRWLLDKYSNFSSWIDSPNNRSLLTAGFPNVIVVVLPKSQVKSAMQTARQQLLEEWQKICDRVFARLKEWDWMPDLEPSDPTWNGWLKAQWQTYWTALPLGKIDETLTNKELENTELFDQWVNKQNQACNLKENSLFLKEEREFIFAVRDRLENSGVNVGSWWPYTFDELRYALSAVKSARTWTIPTAFTMRSTISGIGSVVTPKSYEFKRDQDNNHLPKRDDEQKRHESLQKIKGLFDDKEQLNATETVKRGLHFVLPSLINLSQLNSEEETEERIAASYPDLCSGVAGWLRTQSEEIWQYYNRACADIVQNFSWTKNKKNHTKATAYMPWGIPWIDEKHRQLLSHQKYNPRLLNAGWAIEDCPEQDQDLKNEQLRQLKNTINEYFSPGNNPTDWYVLAVGDGDGMGEWLKGTKLENYNQYLGDALINHPPDAIAESLDRLKQIPKRMGPSTHNALSRALLDFSNRLVPYLTEERYAGRLIYSGGDDVFAYTNLWEWDKWLWDVQQCFRGANDPHGEFNNRGDYWQWQGENKPHSIPKRPLFTMGSKATISFGLVIAHHSVPLAIALESLWQAEAEAKEHKYHSGCYLKNKKDYFSKKDAVQVRVLFGNGNTLSATSKFHVFHCWQELLETVQKLKVSNCNSLPALLEQAAQTWKEHPAPLTRDAINVWVRAFSDRRDILAGNDSNSSAIEIQLARYLRSLIEQTQESECDKQIQNWLKLAAFVLRNRQIKLLGNRE